MVSRGCRDRADFCTDSGRADERAYSRRKPERESEGEKYYLMRLDSERQTVKQSLLD